MRWLVALVGAAVLAAGSWLTLRLTRRPELRVALNLRPGDPDDAALAAGVDLALEEREFAAGRFRLKTAHQVGPDRWRVTKPDPCAHTLLHGIEARPLLAVEGTPPQVGVDAATEGGVLRTWMKRRGLSRLEPVDWWAFQRHPSRLRPGRLMDSELPQEARQWLRAKQPELLRVSSFGGAPLVEFLREVGFEGPLFVAVESASASALPRLEGCRLVLAPLEPPPDFLRRHPHPFVYAGYLGTLRYLDALDRSPKADFNDLARTAGKTPILDTLLGEPRIVVVRNGRLSPE